MTTSYATVPELTARLSATYVAPGNAAQLLDKATELVDFVTRGRARIAWDSGNVSLRAALSRAVCDQVEFWLEVGEEHDVAGLSGSLVAGRVQVGTAPGYLGQRARRQLLRAGLLWAGTGAT